MHSDSGHVGPGPCVVMVGHCLVMGGTATKGPSAVNGTAGGDYSGCAGGVDGLTTSNRNIMSYRVTCAAGNAGTPS